MWSLIFNNFQGIEHRRQPSTPIINKQIKRIMDKSEHPTSGTDVTQTETSAESDKSHTRKPAGRGGRGDRINARNNTRDSLSSTKKY